jgi:histone deacetylase 11
MIPIVYHPGYNIVDEMEAEHPFDGRKYGRIHAELIRRNLRGPEDFLLPETADRGLLSRVHSDAYLDSLQDPATLAGILELPILKDMPIGEALVLAPMRLAVGGTVLAARKALEVHGLAINLGGGFHHAHADHGEGFCVYNDAAVAANVLLEEGLIDRVLVVDLDAHQGNGTASIFNQWWAGAHMFDLFERDNYPIPKESEAYPFPLESGVEGAEYLSIVAVNLPGVIESLRPDLIIYNAGSDPYLGDPLTELRLSSQDIIDRDSMVVEISRRHDIPIVMVLSGGYSEESWRLHADSIANLITSARRERSSGDDSRRG